MTNRPEAARLNVACKQFELYLRSASNLRRDQRLLKMKIYARIRIGDDRTKEVRSATDYSGDTDPSFDVVYRCTILHEVAVHHGPSVLIELYDCRLFLPDRRIGVASVAIHELFVRAEPQDENYRVMRSGEMSCRLSNGSRECQGEVKFAYKFSETANVTLPSWWYWPSNGIVSPSIHIGVCCNCERQQVS